MRWNKFYRYEYSDYEFHREDKPLIPKKATDEEKYEIRQKIKAMKDRIEEQDLPVPQGVRMDFFIVPNGDGSHYSARLSINVPEEKLHEWRDFTHSYIAEVRGRDYPNIPISATTEDFIKSYMAGKRNQLIREIKDLRKEIENMQHIDVVVLGKSGEHRVSGKLNDLKCDCELFKRKGTCHHVALVKTLKENGMLDKDTKYVEPPMVIFHAGKGEADIDKKNYILAIPRKDENKTRTIRMLYNYGYGLSAMKEAGVVPRNMKWEQLKEILDGREYEEVVEGKAQMKAQRGNEIEMGA
ncbi:SWIM zinc finger domain protein [Aciduliprofundum boonei T469]|nr:SWIM zinc finger domain protein [Aciduliprofundum boonei T469]